MLVIGLTGPSGAGKGEVAKLFASRGIPILDADRIYHDLLIPPSPCLDALTQRFGTTILASDGTLNRRALGEIVFSDRQALNDLNTIAHRFVMDEARKRLRELRAKGCAAAVLDAPQLFEAGAQKDCDTVVVVLAKESVRLARIMQRDDIDESRARARMRSQLSEEYFRANADHVIENDGTSEALHADVCALMERLGVK